MKLSPFALASLIVGTDAVVVLASLAFYWLRISTMGREPASVLESVAKTNAAFYVLLVPALVVPQLAIPSGLTRRIGWAFVNALLCYFVFMFVGLNLWGS